MNIPKQLFNPRIDLVMHLTSSYCSMMNNAIFISIDNAIIEEQPHLQHIPAEKASSRLDLIAIA
ncbi:hypothetical protein CAG54_02705 [Vibrio sp. V27_P1S3P104]|uniref:hypothetical protein n=1 Tax=unclassified Vibrio TaxID=2614977 RepID=UPI001372A235|nr:MULTISPECIES: hypothetical protein [unclassified Vibrio]NAW70680.1 hypothetical protein [Vibrio sp. V28_P6S34P95]NAX05051.1 hypothetical protein [Vibrio sp. V30_P3S12P165]NAX36435.1 hypothetical protein [Vibrio sp. V27_P1S3P104]NAX40370.1 hypothetical protein [Vibrio sp. V26_P1S5P106]